WEFASPPGERRHTCRRGTLQACATNCAFNRVFFLRRPGGPRYGYSRTASWNALRTSLLSRLPFPSRCDIITEIRPFTGSAELCVLNAPPCPNDPGEMTALPAIADGSSTTQNPRPHGIPGLAVNVPVCLRVISATVDALRIRLPWNSPRPSIIW